MFRMKPQQAFVSSLTVYEALDRLAIACAGLDKLAHYTCHDEAYFGSPGDFAKTVYDMVTKRSGSNLKAEKEGG